MFNKKQKQLQSDYAQTFKSEAGRRVLENLAQEFHLASPTFHPDPHVVAHSEGERNVVLYILTRLRMTEPDYLKVINDMPLSSTDPDLMEDYNGR